MIHQPIYLDGVQWKHILEQNIWNSSKHIQSAKRHAMIFIKSLKCNIALLKLVCAHSNKTEHVPVTLVSKINFEFYSFVLSFKWNETFSQINVAINLHFVSLAGGPLVDRTYPESPELIGIASWDALGSVSLLLLFLWWNSNVQSWPLIIWHLLKFCSYVCFFTVWWKSRSLHTCFLI